MECAICNSTEFSFHDGVYFCQECNSQIKESRKEECAEEGFSRRSLLRSPAAKKSEKTEQAATKKKYTSYWTTTEAFNIILHKQVCALIKLGASEKLKDVVLHIWAKYLQKCELAFRKDYNAAEEMPRLNVFASKRDVAVLYGEENLKRRKRPSKKKLHKKHSARKNMQEDASHTEDVVTSEPESEVTDNNLTETEAESGSSSDRVAQRNKKKKIKFSSHARKLQRSFGKTKFEKMGTAGAEQCLDKMTVCKALCFCYLGLLYTEDQLLLSDIIRFVNEGKIPYVHATDCFPSSMKIQGSDYKYFAKYSLPDSYRVSRLSGRLYRFLKLPKLNHPSLMPIVCRFIKDINLPDEIMHIVKILTDKIEELGEGGYKVTRLDEGTIPHYETQAMALIAIALKTLFVLDGKYEMEHSEIMTKVNILLGGSMLFVWNDWKKQTMLKEYIFMKRGSFFNDLSLLDSLSTDLIIQKYLYTRIDETQDNRGYTCKQRSCSLLAHKEIKRIITEIKGVNIPSDQTSPMSSSFPLTAQVRNFMDKWKTIPMYKETEHMDFTFLTQDFSSRHLMYKQSKELRTDSELVTLLMSSLYVNSELLTLCDESSYYTNIMRTAAKYWFQNYKLRDMVDRKSVWFEKLPPSFGWLLKFLSKYIHVSYFELYCKVISFEKRLFFQRKIVKAYNR